MHDLWLHTMTAPKGKTNDKQAFTQVCNYKLRQAPKERNALREKTSRVYKGSNPTGYQRESIATTSATSRHPRLAVHRSCDGVSSVALQGRAMSPQDRGSSLSMQMTAGAERTSSQPLCFLRNKRKLRKIKRLTTYHTGKGGRNLGQGSLSSFAVLAKTS